jgi:hypothetical protein
MKTLDIAIGKKLPLDILMQPVALLAQRGWGKTVTAKGCYEAAHDAGAQCITIFPTGKWWSLRLAEDGKSPGLKDVFIIGGPHGDVPLTPASGKVIAKLLIEKRIHAVIDVSLLRKGERHRFLADLFEEFWLLKKVENDNYPVVIFIEEAHAIAPQMLRQGQIDEARMLGAVEDLAAEGRNHGIGIVLLDQRSARVNKNIIALVEVLILGRIGYPSDRKIIGEWVVDKGAEDLEWLKELPRLKPGEAYVYAPVLDIFERLPLRMARTFNATATAKIGERTVKAGALTQVDVSALKDQMAEVIAEAERDDPRALKREVAQLRAELAKKPAAAAPAEPQRIEVPFLSDNDRAAMERLAAQLDGFYEKLSPMRITAADLKEALKAAVNGPKTIITRVAVSGTKVGVVTGAGVRTVAARPGLVVRSKHKPVATRAIGEGGRPTYVDEDGETQTLSSKATEMLGELVDQEPRRLTRDEWALRSGLRNNGNTRNLVSELRTAGFIHQKLDEPTDVGRQAVGVPRRKMLDDLVDLWTSKLSNRAAQMLRVVLASPGIERNAWAEASGIQNNGNFRNLISELNVAALVTSPDRGKTFFPSPALFYGQT